MKVIHATTVPQTLEFLRGQCAYFTRRGAQVVLISSPGPRLQSFAQSEGVPAIAVKMSREISPVADALALLSIVRLLRRMRPDIVHAHTPKAGLLFTAAARLAGVPVCVYQIHGLRFLTTTGARRLLLKAAERLSSTLAHSVIGVSHSVIALARAEKVLPRGKGTVLGSGSVNGVDSEHFSPALAREMSTAFAAEMGISAGDPVIGFVGRIVVDKGIVELATAWWRIREEFPRVRLLIVGAPDDTDSIPPQVLRDLEADPRAHLIGEADDVRPYYGLMTVLALPSYREGFGQVLLEAAACGVASVASDIHGIRDAVIDGVTGRLVPVRDTAALGTELSILISDTEQRERFASAARQRVVADFLPSELWSATWDHDSALLDARKGPRPRKTRG